ncbi:hypothetical protein PGH26_03550 [Sporosarcina jeotgali]|uniref:Uncharacterized protein n=1 Tax=Sporosarcina jeotgali TaxID=3020056 RepID=A0ABZ0L036_9BACL|nr:hypothetical protein [Sporosarcina sp. B2O-1]WOV85016.1 hypothetical protein PGH26_03550 [Sporosarcina sp. B2O-1]
MKKDTEEEVVRLKQQLEKLKQQDQILSEIENRLYEMKKIAEYATQHQLSPEESNRLNHEMHKHQTMVNELELLM